MVNLGFRSRVRRAVAIPQFRRSAMLTMATGLTVAAASALPTPHADNRRLNDSVIANVYMVQHQAGCINDVKENSQLQLAAEWHTRDVLNNRAVDGDIGTDSSTPQDRATPPASAVG